jgi:hypothetical protein
LIRRPVKPSGQPSPHQRRRCVVASPVRPPIAQSRSAARIISESVIRQQGMVIALDIIHRCESRNSIMNCRPN